MTTKGGKTVGRDRETGGWTDVDRRLAYQQWESLWRVIAWRRFLHSA